MLGSGLTNRQIAQELTLSVKTIETYRENIKHKFGLRTAAELMRHAVQWLHTSVAQNATLAGVNSASDVNGHRLESPVASS
jgi:transposase